MPEEPLNIPWESCITMGTSFSFGYEDKYKTPREIITLLTNIVAKGGNLALNVGPQPDGRLPKGALESMKGIGAWLQKYGESIYGTRVCAPYKQDGICFSQKEKEHVVYALKQYEEEGMTVEKSFIVPLEKKVKRAVDLYTGKEVKVSQVAGGYQVELDETEDNAIATVIRFDVE